MKKNISKTKPLTCADCEFLVTLHPRWGLPVGLCYLTNRVTIKTYRVCAARDITQKDILQKFLDQANEKYKADTNEN